MQIQGKLVGVIKENSIEVLAGMHYAMRAACAERQRGTKGTPTMTQIQVSVNKEYHL